MHQIQSRTYIGESVKPTAGADAIAGIRRIGNRVIDKGLLRRGADRVRSIAQIAVGRVNRQADQHHTQEPCNDARPCCELAVHLSTITFCITKLPAVRSRPQPWSFHFASGLQEVR